MSSSCIISNTNGSRETHTSYETRRFFYLFVHETQKTYEIHSSKDTLRTVHSSYESHAVRARFIGREEREFVITPRCL